MSLIQWIHFPPLGDERGSLVVLEDKRNVPFDIKRVYYVFGTKKGIARGFHAHKNLKQVAVCIAGKCRMVMDDGRKKESIWLDSPTQGILITTEWHEMHDFSEDCILLVLASDHYDENDYIRNYDQFLEEADKVVIE